MLMHYVAIWQGILPPSVGVLFNFDSAFFPVLFHFPILQTLNYADKCLQHTIQVNVSP